MTVKTTFKVDTQIQKEIEDLLTDIRSTLITKRLKAVKALGRLKTPIACDPLANTLHDRSREVRCAAIEALSLINPGNLPDIILPLVRDKSADVRLRVAHALGTCDTSESIEGLMALIRDSRDEVASMAARSLARHPRASLALLIRQFGDKSWKIRSRSATAVSRMGKGAGEALKSAVEDNDFQRSILGGHLPGASA